MRILLACITSMLFVLSAMAHPYAEPRPSDPRRVAISSHFERHVEELRAGEAHTDDYLVISLEIAALRRDHPEHREFLDRYLQSLLPR
ncbi:MAG TPA: hypothetical protein VFR73_06070 [Hyphomicrobiaceae bacterium]|nr:hypothetical protein [Hyphomicrobiaceae bacterium]